MHASRSDKVKRQSIKYYNVVLFSSHAEESHYRIRRVTLYMS